MRPWGSRTASSPKRSASSLTDRQAVRLIDRSLAIELWRNESDRLAGYERPPRNMRGSLQWVSLGSGVTVRSTASSGLRRQTCPAFYAMPD